MISLHQHLPKQHRIGFTADQSHITRLGVGNVAGFESISCTPVSPIEIGT
jgi:hypothetical protein